LVIPVGHNSILVIISDFQGVMPFNHQKDTPNSIPATPGAICLLTVMKMVKSKTGVQG
jgi:hypothetical protein